MAESVSLNGMMRWFLRPFLEELCYYTVLVYAYMRRIIKVAKVIQHITLMYSKRCNGTNSATDVAAVRGVECRPLHGV